jgi:inward rectifier potassium channel
MSKQKNPSNKSRAVRIGSRIVMTQGIETRFWSDFYHRAMHVSWPQFFIFCATFFMAINCLFALFYYLGHDPIANIRPDHIEDLFFFSIETLATVGYGNMYPQTTYGHLLATAEIFVGLSFITVMTGLVFNRFARPQARILFAEKPIIGPHNGQSSLMLRIANERHNLISEARAELWFSINEISLEGVPMRRFYQLALERSQNPFFALSWTLFHPITDESPLKAMTEELLQEKDALFVVTFHGLDDQSGHILNARRTYAAQDLRWNSKYTDILTQGPDGLPHINYNHFHDILPVK